MTKKIVGADGMALSCSSSIKGVKPCGSQILVEVLTAQELMNTVLKLSDGTDPKVPLQGYVKAVGPTYNESWGFKVGDRVLISGAGVLSPNVNGTHRDTFLMEPMAIRAVLSE